jgi:hypothetical protein
MQRPDVSRVLTPLPLTESPPDRRKHKRYKVREGSLVSPVSTNRKYWKMIDVSLGGMSFRYIPYQDPNGFSQIDIVTQDLEFRLEGIPFKVISDCEFTDSSTSLFELRRCGVQFGLLPHPKQLLLDEFIRKYTLL